MKNEKKWMKPQIKVVDSKRIEKKEFKVLTIESSLYASGCHGGMIKAY
jgi:hypothetical protein